MPFEQLTEYMNLHGHRGAGGSDSAEEEQKTVLLLDDEVNIIKALTRTLRRDGYRILSSTSISEAFTLLAENEVQVIISDQRMPEMSDTEFSAR